MHGIALGAVYSNGTREMQAELGVMLKELLVLVAEGKVRSHREQEKKTLSDVAELLTRLRSSHVHGKLTFAI